MSIMRVSSSKLKAKLGQYLKAVRAGREIVITDRDEPIARLVPFRPAPPEGLVIAKPRDPSAPPLGQLRVRAVVRLPPGVDSLSLLMEDRNRR